MKQYNPYNQPTSKPSMSQRFKELNANHPVLMNILYILLAIVAVCWLLMLFIDAWTRHGVEIEVPSLKGQSIELAEATLIHDGFRCEVMDSVFEGDMRPGTVVEQTPPEGSRVKPGRTVYVTIVATNPKMVIVPDFVNVSRRQGVSIFEGLGIKVHVVTVNSEYKDLVLGAKYNGVPLRPGQRIPVTANVTLEVGGGASDTIPSDEMDNYVMPDASEVGIEDETVNLLLE